MTCAYAVRGALNKFQGVESVDVSLNKGLATVKLKPGNTVRPQEFWETVHKNGFTPKATRVLVRGMAIGGGNQLKVTGTDQILELKGDSKATDEVKRMAGKTITIDGVLTPGQDLKRSMPLEVLSVREN
jgi:copper chaperone CopZ